MSISKWAALGDLQIPYHDKRAVDLVMKALKWWKPDAIDFTGDIADCLEYSRFSDGTTDDFFNRLKKEKQLEDESDQDFRMRISPLPHVIESQKETANFFKDFRAQHKNADMHFSLGNHEKRVEDYVDKKMPQFKEEVTPNALWGVDDLGITWRPYELPPLLRFAGIHVHHGDTSTTTGLSVKNDIENYDISLMRGHDHRGGVVFKTYPLSERRLVGVGTGHLCDPHAYGLRYTFNPGWELGFAVVHVVNDRPYPQFVQITDDYTCVLDGKVFSG